VALAAPQRHAAACGILIIMAVTSRSDWERIQQIGLRRYMATAALRHGLFMTVVVTFLLELFAGTTLTRERVTSSEFLLRTGLCLLVFGASGAVSSYARWRSSEALFGKADGESVG
jgi:hypothetical protein